MFAPATDTARRLAFSGRIVTMRQVTVGRTLLVSKCWLHPTPLRATRNCRESYEKCREREKVLRITFTERRVGDQLTEFFRRTDCSVEQVGKHSLEVNPCLPLLADAARLEIEGLLRVWCKLHPELSVTVALVGPANVAIESDLLAS